MPDVWKKEIGGRGCRVIVRERVPGGALYLYVPRRTGGYDMKSLGHRDRKAALAEGHRLASQLLRAKQALRAGRVPLSVLFAQYEQAESVHKKGEQPKEDRRRIQLWTAFYGADDPDARAVTRNDMKAFIRARRAGTIQLPPFQRPDGRLVERQLKKNPKPTTIGADIVFLQTVLNWAVDERLLRRSPLAGYKPPRTRNPAQPVATYDRFLQVYRYSARVSPMFRYFFGLIGNELDWRVSALCRLKLSHIDLTGTPAAPAGRIWKAPEKHDEEGLWVPLTPWGRAQLQRAVRKRGAVGDVYLFESPRRKGKPWRRQHARDLLERAEALAGLLPIEGGDFHPYRRKWSTERKHHAWADIAAVSGRKDRATFERSYAKADLDSMLAVVNESRRLRREAEAKTEAAPTRQGKRDAG